MICKFSLTEAQFPHMGENVMYFVFEDSISKDDHLKQLIKLTDSRLKMKMEQHSFSGKPNQMVTMVVGHTYQNVVLVGMGNTKDLTPALFKNRVADAVRTLTDLKLDSAQIIAPESFMDLSEIGENAALGTLLGNYEFTRYKSQELTKYNTRMKSVEVVIKKGSAGKDGKKRFENGVQKGVLIAEGVILTRNLVNEPASHVVPETLAKQAREIAKNSKGKVTVQVLEAKDCEKLGMGSFLSVAQGSDSPPKFIVLKYNPKLKEEKLEKKIALIGKSVTFDSGGLSIKPAEYMEDMKMDMAGGAAVLGVFSALANWDEKAYGKIHYEVYGILAACENMINGKAFRPGDVVTAMNGTTIEVMNTDAEGRLTLADALSYARMELKANIAIDMATLTGAAMVAVGTEITPYFTNSPQLAEVFEVSATMRGEEVCQLPLYKRYLKDMDSDVADIKNITKHRWAGAITAALFLEVFAKDLTWLHADIAGPAYNGASPYGVTPKCATGWGVQTLLEVITNKSL